MTMREDIARFTSLTEQRVRVSKTSCYFVVLIIFILKVYNVMIEKIFRYKTLGPRVIKV